MTGIVTKNGSGIWKPRRQGVCVKVLRAHDISLCQSFRSLVGFCWEILTVFILHHPDPSLRAACGRRAKWALAAVIRVVCIWGVL